MSLDKILVAIGFFTFLMSVAGIAGFFASDYAQKRWNPNYKDNNTKQE